MRDNLVRALVVCEDGSEAFVPHGLDGTSCSVDGDVVGEDGTGVRLSCGDTTTAVLFDGQDGQDGMDGQSCVVTAEPGCAGGLVRCGGGPEAGGTEVCITNGRNGIGCEIVEDENCDGAAVDCGGTGAVCIPNGTDGIGCEIVADEDCNGVSIECGGTGPVCIPNGMDGASCELSSTDNCNGNPGAVLRCGTDTVCIPGAI